MAEADGKQPEGSINGNQNEPEKGPEKQEPAKDLDISNLKTKMDAMQLERMMEVHKTLKETEARIDKKLQDFKKFVDTTEISGRALAGPQLEESEEEKQKKAARKLVEGTGLSFD
jgi:hypothetical protein